MEKTSYRVETPFGPVEVTPYVRDGQRHVYVSARHAEYKYGPITVHRVKYTMYYQLVDYGDGFETVRNENGHTDYRMPNMTRVEWERVSQMNASGAAFKAVRTEIPKIINEWAEAHPEVFTNAAVEDTKTALDRVTAEIAAKEKELNELRAGHDALQDAHAKAVEAHKAVAA